MLCDKAIQEFSKIYQQEYGVLLPEDQACLKANKVFSFFKTIVDEISKSDEVSNCSKKGGLKNGNKNKGKSI